MFDEEKVLSQLGTMFSVICTLLMMNTIINNYTIINGNRGAQFLHVVICHLFGMDHHDN